MNFLRMFFYKRKMEKFFKKTNLKESDLKTKNCYDCKFCKNFGRNLCCSTTNNQPRGGCVCDMFQYENSYLKEKINRIENKFNFRRMQNE